MGCLPTDVMRCSLILLLLVGIVGSVTMTGDRYVTGSAELRSVICLLMEHDTESVPV